MSDTNDYRCMFCEKYYKSPSSRSNHIRKYHKDCVVVKEQQVNLSVVVKKQQKSELLNCKHCTKLLADRTSKWRHEKICNQGKLIEIKKDNDILKTQVNELITKVNNSLNNNNNHNQQISGDNNNTLNNSGCILNIVNNDNLSFITPEFFKKLLKETLFEEDHQNVIPKVIQEVKFNKDHPENHNIKMDDKKKKTAEVFTKDGWKKIDEDVCIDYLTKRGYQIFRNLSDIHENQIKGRYIESKESFTENFLNGNIKEGTNNKMKDVVTKAHKMLSEQSREELEEELSKELNI